MNIDPATSSLQRRSAARAAVAAAPTRGHRALRVALRGLHQLPAQPVAAARQLLVVRRARVALLHAEGLQRRRAAVQVWRGCAGRRAAMELLNV